MNQVRMKNNRHRRLIERIVQDPSIPEALTRDIVTLAQRHLQAISQGRNPQHRDVTWAVTRAWRDWSRRFAAALDSRGSVDGSLQTAA